MSKLRWLLLIVLCVPVIFVALFLLTPDRWIANQLESRGSDYLDAQLLIGDLSLDFVDRFPSASFSNISLRKSTDSEFLTVGAFDSSIDLKQLLKGNVIFKHLRVVDSTLVLAMNSDNTNSWDFIMPKTTTQNETNEASPLAIPLVDKIDVENFHISVNDVVNNRTAELDVAINGSTIRTDQDTTLNVNGTLNGLPATVEATLTSLALISNSDGKLALDVNGHVSDDTFTASGSIPYVDALKNIDIDFTFEASGTEDLETLAGIALPVLPSFALAGNLSRDESYFVLRRFDGRLGESDMEGDVRIDLTTDPMTVYANVISKRLELDDLTGIIAPPPDNEDSVSQAENAKRPKLDQYLLPDGIIDLLPLTELFNGAIEFRADTVKSGRWPIEAMDARIEVIGLKTSMDPVFLKIAGGDVSGSIEWDMTQQIPLGVMELEVSRLQLRELLIAIGVDDDSVGVIGGRLKYWIKGRSIREMASNMDGGVFLLMTEGKFDALLTELAGLDLFESITLLVEPGKTFTDVRCAYAEIHAKSGLMEISTVIFDTADTVFLADGSVDINSETLDLTLEPHPKDASILAAESAVHIQGTFADPTLVPGRALPARAVAAAALASLATPLLAVLPLIEAGSGEDSDYCSGLVTALDDADQ